MAKLNFEKLVKLRLTKRIELPPFVFADGLEFVGFMPCLDKFEIYHDKKASIIDALDANIIEPIELNILQIDAWGNKKDGYQWNNWFKIGTVSDVHLMYCNAIDSNQLYKLLLNDYINLDFRRFRLEDDGYNVIVTRKIDDRPILAIEYGDTL